MKELVTKTIEAYKKINCVVNNAGTVFSGLIPQTSLEDWQMIHDVNVTSTYLVYHHVLPYMIE